MEANVHHARMDTSGSKSAVIGNTEGKASASAAPVSSPAPEPHIIHVRADRPIDVSFSFEHPQSRVGVSASIISHVAMAFIAFLVMRYQPEAQSLDLVTEVTNKDIVWLSDPGPGGGGGGGGNNTPEPPKKAELPGKEKITVPIEKKPEPIPDLKAEPPPLEDLNIPAKPMADAEQPLPGAIQSESLTISQGPGTGGGAGTGTGTGIGSGTGSGLGPGWGGGSGGGAYRPGSGVTIPRLVREVKPQYTADAMRAKVQGMVLVECIVMPDGTVGDAKIIRSLDSVFGLDQEALKAARQWKFLPGMRQGEPVPVIITIELTFTLR
jgi:periplasmic protein TonB